MEKCPVCGNYTLVFEEYYDMYICLTRRCGASELSSKRIKELAKEKWGNKITVNDLVNDMKKIKKSLDRSKKFKQEFIDLVKEKEKFKTLGKMISESSIKLHNAMVKAKKREIPDEIIIHMDFQIW